MKFSLWLILFLFTSSAFAQTFADSSSTSISWDEFSSDIKKQIQNDRTDGISYIVSGSLALAGGLVGAGVADDPIEQGVYSVFQTIGIASAAYGLYTWRVGGNERELYAILRNTPGISELEKTMLLRSYARIREDREKKERLIKLLTHSLIAGLNIYNATQQTNDSAQNALYFVGGINGIAAISYSF